MADPIKHDVGSGLVTAGWESFKGIGKAFGAVIAAPAVMLGALGATVGVLGALTVGAFTAVGFGSVVGAGLGLGLLGAAAGAIGGGMLIGGVGFFSAPAAGIIAAAGALFGLAQGGRRITRENTAANQKMEKLSGGQQARDAAIFQAGQQSVVGAIQQQMERQAAMQQQLAEQQEAAARQKLNPENFKKNTVSHADAALKSKSENTLGHPER